ncbi:MAG: helix-turn-helix transcriptional regulator [bacterium]|nr:helix-turn-helix transcriptional regulator [bacterium]
MTIRKRPVNVEIRARIKKLREIAGCNQRDMAARLGITASAYSKYELGLNFLSIEAMQRMSQKLDVSIDWLLFNKGSMYNRDNDREIKELKKQMEQLKGQLEAERKEREAERKGEGTAVREAGPAGPAGSHLELNLEERELFEAMKRVPMLYHKIMLHFQEFKSASPSLLEASPSPG